MITDENFLKQLKSIFDLNIYEAKIWVALLSKGLATAGELSEISSVPRSRSYDILESLEKKGFIVMKLGKPIKYLAVKPNEVVYRLKKNIEVDRNKQIVSLEKSRETDTFQDLELLYKNGVNHVDSTNLSGMIKGRKNVYAQIESLLRNAKGSVIISTSEKGLVRKVDNFKNLLNKLNKNGVNVRISAPLKDKELVKDLKGIQIKHTDNSSRFVIVDSKDVVFMLTHDKDVIDKDDHAVWVSSPYFAKSLEGLFEVSWKK